MSKNLILAIVLSPVLTFVSIVIYLFSLVIFALLGGSGTVALGFGISLPFLLGINLIAFMLIFTLLQWRSIKPLS